MRSNAFSSYDLTYLVELSAGDKQFVHNIVSQFVLSVPEVFAKITDALEKERWEELEYELHKFAPSLAFVGIADLKQDIYSLEEYARKKNAHENAHRALESIINRCETAVLDLKRDFNL